MFEANTNTYNSKTFTIDFVVNSSEIQLVFVSNIIFAIPSGKKPLEATPSGKNPHEATLSRKKPLEQLND